MKTRITLLHHYITLHYITLHHSAKLKQKSRHPKYAVTCIPNYLLGAFVKLRKATVIYVECVCLSARNNFAPTRRIYKKFDYFSKICRANTSLLKSDNNNGHFT